MILDMQIHFWEAQRPDRPWARDIPASLPEPFGPERFLPMMDTAGVDRAVIVPPAYVFPSNAYGLECARAYPNRFGVMGLIDLRQPDVEEQVAGWRAQPGMLGLRISLTARGRSLWSDEAAVERFWAACERDALPVTVMAAGATDYVERLLKRHPALALCIDHLGLPLIDAPADDEGFVRFLALARYPQLVAKISTLPARSTTGYPFSEVHDLARRAYEAFGPERLLWGSDHTQTLGRGRATYAEELRLFTEALDFLDDQERRAMLGENALHYLRWPADVRSTGVKE